MEPFFSVIVVCLNPGKKLLETLESIKGQSFCDYEVIIKDGLSTDGSLEKAQEIMDGKTFRLISQRDQGIYDAMNQAAAQAKGKYVYFLNCGDRFYSEQVLSQMADFIKTTRKEVSGKGQKQETLGVYYGNIYERLTGQKVASNPHMDAFGCYRNVPCHQACFYSRELLLMHPFQSRYKVRADYEQFLWCFFSADAGSGVTFAYQDMMIADYEGGGFSETKENKRISAAEHREITRKYLSPLQLLWFRSVMLFSLAPLRTRLAENEKTAGLYNRIKGAVYRKKK